MGVQQLLERLINIPQTNWEGAIFEVFSVIALETCGIQDKRHGMGCQCLIRDSAFHRWCAVQGMPTAMGTSQMGMVGYGQYAQGEVTLVLVYFSAPTCKHWYNFYQLHCCLVCAGQYPGYGAGYGYSDPYGRLQNHCLFWSFFGSPVNFATFRPYGSSMGEQVPSGIFCGESCENFLGFLGTVLRLWLHAGGWGQSTVCNICALACLGHHCSHSSGLKCDEQSLNVMSLCAKDKAPPPPPPYMQLVGSFYSTTD